MDLGLRGEIHVRQHFEAHVQCDADNRDKNDQEPDQWSCRQNLERDVYEITEADNELAGNLHDLNEDGETRILQANTFRK